jgi:hypothetical protein
MITIRVWTGVTTGRDRNVGGENLIVDGHTGISVEYGHHCTTSEHVTTLSRPYQSQYDRYLIRTELEIEVVPGPLLLLLDVNRSPARRLWYAHRSTTQNSPLAIARREVQQHAPAVFHFPVACCHNAVVNVQCPRATCARELSVSFCRADESLTNCICRNALPVLLR